MNSLNVSEMNNEQQMNVAILMWKCLPKKAEFAQELAEYIEGNIDEAKEKFNVPLYILSSINHILS